MNNYLNFKNLLLNGIFVYKNKDFYFILTLIYEKRENNLVYFIF